MDRDRDLLTDSLLKEAQSLLDDSRSQAPRWMLRRALNTIEALQGRLTEREQAVQEFFEAIGAEIEEGEVVAFDTDALFSRLSDLWKREEASRRSLPQTRT